MIAVALMLGCSGPDPGPGSTTAASTREDEPDSTRASREAVAVRERGVTIEAPSPAAPPEVQPLFVARPVDAERGEDGRGETVAATAPIAFDLDARRFPPRALDPVLHVGDLRFVHYTHPRVGVLRFVAADRAALPEGARVFVQYGEAESTRTVVADALELP